MNHVLVCAMLQSSLHLQFESIPLDIIDDRSQQRVVLGKEMESQMGT